MSHKEIDRLTLIRQWQAKAITQKQAFEALGLSEQHFRHLIRLYEQDGPKALMSKQRGKLSNNRLNNDLRKNAIALIKRNCSPHRMKIFFQKPLTHIFSNI